MRDQGMTGLDLAAGIDAGGVDPAEGGSYLGPVRLHSVVVTGLCPRLLLVLRWKIIPWSLANFGG